MTRTLANLQCGLQALTCSGQAVFLQAVGGFVGQGHFYDAQGYCGLLVTLAEMFFILQAKLLHQLLPRHLTLQHQQHLLNFGSDFRGDLRGDLVSGLRAFLRLLEQHSKSILRVSSSGGGRPAAAQAVWIRSISPP